LKKTFAHYTMIQGSKAKKPNLRCNGAIVVPACKRKQKVKEADA
jgi:hypothetical protein